MRMRFMYECWYPYSRIVKRTIGCDYCRKWSAGTFRIPVTAFASFQESGMVKHG